VDFELNHLRTHLLWTLLLCSFAAFASAQQAEKDPALPQLCASCVHANLQYLAGPQLRGRGSGTPDEHAAAQFIAQKLREHGVSPAAENGHFIQTATLRSRSIIKAPVLFFDAGSPSMPIPMSWKHGKQMVVFQVSEPRVGGQLQKLDLTRANDSLASIKDGAAVLLKLKPDTNTTELRETLKSCRQTTAAIVLIPEIPAAMPMFDRLAGQKPKAGDDGSGEPHGPAIILVRSGAADELWQLPEGTRVKLRTHMTNWKTSYTWNVLGQIDGTSKKDQVILLSAHLDHLGVKNGKTYPGADDDASGTAAVLELARVLAAGPKLARTVVFALWGSEEVGAIGSQYFLRHPTFDLKNIVANLEFEMLARPDPNTQSDQLWLTGWERTDLGPELADHGANLVGDPHPEEKFFTRSDNYVLAKQGIVAQTVSSYGLHHDYHQPTDMLSRVDWQHLDNAISSMITPIMWLANNDFIPKWEEGMKP
jgi:hypothetical protein